MEKLTPAKISVYNPLKDIWISEMSYMLLDESLEKLLAIGETALERYQQAAEPSKVVLCSPFRGNILEDFVLARELINEIINKVYGKKLKRTLFGNARTLILLGKEHVSTAQKELFCNLSYITTLPKEIVYMDMEGTEVEKWDVKAICKTKYQENPYRVAIIVEDGGQENE